MSVDDELEERISRNCNSKRDEIDGVDEGCRRVMNYGRWVIPPEGINISSRFDISSLNKVYIGNIVSQRDIILNLLSVFGPVSVTILNAKECVFADFDNPHGAHLCMNEVNGMMFEGRKLKAGRTSRFPHTIPEELRNPDKSVVYISNLDERVEDEQLEEIFSNIGSVETVRLVYTSSFIHSGYGYVKFDKNHDARKALSCNDRVMFYGKRMKIGPVIVRMTLPPRNHPNIPEEILRIKKRIENAVFCRGRVVILRNLIEIDDADDDFDQEIENEMRKYGEVVNIRIDKDKEVVVYCLYSTNDEAKHSFNILNGRFFGGRRIRAEMSDDELA